MRTNQPDFVLNRPGALIAALPAILGFVPEKSLVLVTVSDAELGSVLRADLSPRMSEVLGHLAQVAAAAESAAVIAVIVDGEGAGCRGCTDEHRQLCAALAAELSRYGMTLRAAHVVDRVASGGRWHCADGCGEGGLIDDPGASPLAAAAVLDGRRLYSCRADLQAVIAVEPAVREQVGALIADHAAARDTDCGADPQDRVRRDVEIIVAATAVAGSGRHCAATELAAMGCALTDMTVRDMLFALAVSERASDAEALWAALARSVPDPWRAEALVLLAFSAYVRGDGPLAGVSLEGALRCAPGHRMAGMLDTALQSGLRPAQIRELADTGYRLAERIGARLPPRQLDRRAG